MDIIKAEKPLLYAGIIENRRYLNRKNVDLNNMIACGGIGCVFPLKGIHDAVAKITCSRGEFEYYELVSRYEKSIFPKVYLSEEMPKKARYAYQSKKIYLTIREAVMPFTSIDPYKENIFGEELDLAIEDYSDSIFDANIEGLEKATKRLEEAIETAKDPRVRIFLKDLLFFMGKNIVFTDVSYDNIGLSFRNEIKIYDAFIGE